MKTTIAVEFVPAYFDHADRKKPAAWLATVEDGLADEVGRKSRRHNRQAAIDALVAELRHSSQANVVIIDTNG